MAFDEALAGRIRAHLGDRSDVEERRMFGGITFMLSGNMCCGVIGDDLCVRLTPEQGDELLTTETGCRPMDFTGRPMRGWLYVEPEAIDADEDLARWVSRAEAFADSLPPK